MNETLLYSLLQSMQRSDPRLHDMLKVLITEVQKINNEVFPPSSSVTVAQTNVVSVVADLLSFFYLLIPDGIQLSWTRPNGVSFFEIRTGATWDAGSRVLVTSTLSAVISGRAPGSYVYHIKGIDDTGAYSVNALALTVVIPALGSITVTGQVIDNNILLTWSVPLSSFRIQHYIVRKNGTSVGTQAGTFAAYTEIAGGTYTYSIQAVDIFGNLNVASSLALTVSQPPDYILKDIATSSLAGTKVNALVESGTPSLIANIALAATWNSHFVDNGWNTIQDQITAGFPYYLQPTLPTGSYQEVFDYGTIFDNVIATANWNFNQVVPTMQVNPFLSTSLDNITYGSEVSGVQIFASSLRYVKLRITFTALN